MGAAAVLGACGPMLAVPPPEAPPAVKPSGPICQVTVRGDANFWGTLDTFTSDKANVGTWWNDKISSIEIAAGVWTFYENVNFEGASVTVGPGRYPNLGSYWNDRISSFRCLGPSGPVSRDPWRDTDRPTPY
jgi:hypothetical protein